MHTRTGSSRVAGAVDQFFAKDVAEFTRRLSEIESSIRPDRIPRHDEVFEQVCDAVGAARTACSEVEESIGQNEGLLKGVQDQYRLQIAPWFDRSWFMHRATTKPRGYPGDYATLAAIYDGQTKSTGIGGYLDLYFLNTTLGRAVAERLQAARRFLIDEVNRRKGTIRILNVACGPCREFVGGMKFSNDSDVHVTCIDYDREALDFVNTHVVNVEDGIPPIELVRYNALRMSSTKANIRTFGKQDIIYSVGLCDYIPDDRLVAMLKGLRETLNEGGVLYVAFKDMLKYDKTDYQWLTDWFFLQRTEEECRSLLLAAGFEESAMDMSRDSTESIMNFTCRVKRPSHVRIDAPAQRPIRESLGHVPMREQNLDSDTEA